MMQEEPEEKTILVIDDEENNIAILTLDLEEAGYTVLSALDGEAGWAILCEQHDRIKAILLDRMMPTMDGMAFMSKIKAEPQYDHIPVIMQTAAAEKSEVEEGINAGVYYYLGKPYEASTMLSLVRAAIQSYSEYRELKDELTVYKKKLYMLKESRFEIKTLDEARYLSTFLANFYPDGQRVILGISELLINAIEHGNLGISYEDKTRLNTANIWEQTVFELQQLPEHKDKKVHVHFKRQEEVIVLTITDEGCGFDWSEYMDFSPDRATDNHGRGIALSQLVSFDEIKYVGHGNQVVCSIDTSKNNKKSP